MRKLLVTNWQNGFLLVTASGEFVGDNLRAGKSMVARVVDQV
jgi:hypothetical protein